jgi:hypothetical protein
MDLGFLKAILPGTLGTVVTVASLIIAIIEKYKADIAIITLAVEKANDDGVVTGAEKKEIANKVYFECVKPKLTGKWILLRLIPDVWIKSIIGKMIDNVCKIAKDNKVTIPAK